MEHSLAELGWNSHWDDIWARQASANGALGTPPASADGAAWVAGRVAREDRDGYLAFIAAGSAANGGPGEATRDGSSAATPEGPGGATREVLARLCGRLRHDARERGDLPAVGDWVALRLATDGGLAVIHAILARKSCFSRKAVRAGGPQYRPGRTEEQVLAANVDTAFLVSGLNEDFNPRRIERYLATAWSGGARPVIVLNKSDLCDDVAARVARVEPSAIGVPIHALSAATGAGLSALDAYLGRGQTVVFLGSSGVGKSSLINRLLGSERQETRDVRAFDGRGRHATTAREMFPLPGGAVLIDTPGLREIQVWDDDGGAAGTSRVFADVDDIAAGCRFRDCTHDHEPGCAVKQAVADGRLDPGRLCNYLKLRREEAVLAIRRSQRARMVFGKGGKRLPGSRG